MAAIFVEIAKFISAVTENKLKLFHHFLVYFETDNHVLEKVSVSNAYSVEHVF